MSKFSETSDAKMSVGTRMIVGWALHEHLDAKNHLIIFSSPARAGMVDQLAVLTVSGDGGRVSDET